MKRSYLLIVVACIAVAVAAGLLWRPVVDDGLDARLPGPVSGAGFATSGSCQACHPGEYDAWHRSYHRTMTQPASPAAVLGTFDGRTLQTRGLKWRVERRNGEFWVEMPDPAWFERPSWLMRALDADWPDAPPTIEARVVMTTGSHHMQNYWIRRPTEAELGADNGALVQVPWVWLIDEKRWVPNQDSFLTPPQPSVGAVLVWNANCSQCHSVGTKPGVATGDDAFDTRSVELGVACEACHGPAEEHARKYRSPLARYARYVRDQWGGAGPDSTIVNPAELDPRRSVEVCGQCHSFGMWRDQEDYRRRGIPYRPGDDLEEYRRVFSYDENPTDPLVHEMLEQDSLALQGRFWGDGTNRVAGREYNAFLASSHFTKSDLTCLSCHSMHGYESRDKQLAVASEGDRACLGCHEDLEGRIPEHTHHRPGSAGSACMNCHMPYTKYGLFAAMRSHRIDSPSVRISVESGRPNACNLCHLDQTLEWTNEYLQAWYDEPSVQLDLEGRSVAASSLWALKGDAAQRTIVAWHMGWKPAREASGDEWMAPFLAELLADGYAATRDVAFRSLATLPGFDDFEYDYVAPPAELMKKADEAVARWRSLRADSAATTRPYVLVDGSGRIDLPAWRRLLAERDDRPLTIRE